MAKDISLTDYQEILKKARQTILAAQQKFLLEANQTSIVLYWQLGKLLTEIAEKYQWGQQILARLSRDLSTSFTNARGYSEQNLRYMRQFYYEYANSPELLEIAKLAARADNILKASYFLEVSKPFIGSKSLLEKQIENEMVHRIKDVLMMLGKGFSFIGNQYVLNVGDNTYRIDLLFFNRITLSLIAVELKMSRFKAEYAGKMNLYLKLLDEKVKLPHENNSIGLILCTDRNDVEVDYILPETIRPIGVAELRLSKVLPQEWIGKLPDPHELEHELLHTLEDLKSSKKNNNESL